MLEFVHVDKTYKNKVCALNDCNFKIEQGEFVFLIGPSGAGKSTITKLILKEINPAFTLDDVISATEAPLILSDSLNGKISVV